MPKQPQATPTRRPLPVKISSADIQVLYSEHLLGFQEQWLEHDFVKVVIVDGGLGKFQTEGLSVDLSAGDMLIVPAGCLHRWLDAETAALRLVIACCSTDRIDADVIAWLSEARFLRAVNAINREQRLRFAYQLLQEQVRQETGYLGILQSLIHAQIIPFMRTKDIAQGTQMQDIAAYMEAHLNEPLSIQDLADRCNMSYRSFTTYFKRSFGFTCQQYQRNLRIRAAEDLLVSGIPILQIALELGYSDASNFYKAFTQVHNCAPGQWLAGR